MMAQTLRNRHHPKIVPLLEALEVVAALVPFVASSLVEEVAGDFVDTLVVVHPAAALVAFAVRHKADFVEDKAVVAVDIPAVAVDIPAADVVHRIGDNSLDVALEGKDAPGVVVDRVG